MRPSNRPIILAILISGLSSITAQIVLTRELLVVFYGNELSIGLILGVWLLMGGLGGWAFGRISDKTPKKLTVFIICQLLSSFLILLSVILIRWIRPVFGILPGELASLPIIALSSLIILSPICLLAGFLFTLSCRMLKIYGSEGVGQVGYAYALEALGAASGGLLCNLLLIKIFASFNIALFIFGFNLIAALWLAKYSSISQYKRNALRICVAGILLALILLKTTHKLDLIDSRTKEIEWRGFNLLENRNSIYGNLNVTKRDSLYSFFSNGILMFTVPDLLTQEENIHFAMLQRPDAKKVLLIGGGAGGALWEILKYPVESVDYVELDPTLIELSEKHLRDSESFSLKNPRVNIIRTDGRFYIQNTENLYELIILNLPDPYTAQLNRFYTLEFFTAARRRLGEDGVLCFGLSSSENYISQELAVFLSSVYSTLKSVFADIKIVPGDTAYFLASSGQGLLTLDHNTLVKRLKRHGIQTQFVRDYYLFSKLSEERLAYMNDRLRAGRRVRINRDFSPISYYYDMVLWSTHFNNNLKVFLKRLTNKVLFTAAAFTYILILSCGLFWKRRKNAKAPILVAVATTGVSEISFELILIIAFQVLYGYLYYKLGIIITAFMIGLGAGGFIMTRRLDSLKDPYREFTKVQVAICLYPLLLPVVFYILRVAEFGLLKSLGSNVIFTLLPVVAGVMGGLQFPLANKLRFERTERLGRVAGLNYGADMVGSCFGAILISAFIIPVAGITAACLMVALLNLSSLLILIVNKN